MDAMPGVPGELRSRSDTIMLNARVEGCQALLHVNNLETDGLYRAWRQLF